MDTIQTFEDFIYSINKNKVRYLIIGGLAFIFHAKPRYTKDMDIWIEPETENIENTNKALAEFGSPYFISLPVKKDEILQLGVAPDRIDILLNLPGVSFKEAWNKKVISEYGKVESNWIDIDSLITVKKMIDTPRHQEDVQCS
jgi:hypothetical protein